MLDIQDLIQIRRKLHANPELSGKERETVRLIKDSIGPIPNSEWIEEIGGPSCALIIKGKNQGPTVLFRCELDALPIQENNNFPHRSRVIDVSHKCGHDGHITILIGLAHWIKKRPLKSGKLILFFQSAEENGQGALKAIHDKKFEILKPDYCFALHNIPGFKENQVLIVPDYFSASVESMAIDFIGTESHASEPEKGNNPSSAISEMIQFLNGLNQANPFKKDYTIITIVCIRMGQIAYGISPGSAELHITYRCWSEENKDRLKSEILNQLKACEQKYGLKISFSISDTFPSNKNNEECNHIIAQSAESVNLDLISMDHPFKFGEDFGWFSQKYRTGMFGLGAGKNWPALHRDDYDFNEQLIPVGIQIFISILEKIYKKNDEGIL